LFVRLNRFELLDRLLLIAHRGERAYQLAGNLVQGSCKLGHGCLHDAHQQRQRFVASRQLGDAVELRCLEHATGKVLWSEPGLTRATLLHARGPSPDGYLVVLTEYGRLLLVEATPERYKPIAEMNLGEARGASPKSPIAAGSKDRPVLRFPAWNAPILAHGLLYLRGKDQLICLDVAPDAAPIGELDASRMTRPEGAVIDTSAP